MKKRFIANIVNALKKKSFRQLGHVIFAVGMLLVLIFTFENPPNQIKPWQGLVLLAVGLLIGIMDIKQEELVPFLLAFIGIIIVSNAPLQDAITYKQIGAFMKSLLVNTAIFLTLAVVAVCARIIYRIYKESRS